MHQSLRKHFRYSELLFVSFAILRLNSSEATRSINDNPKIIKSRDKAESLLFMMCFDPHRIPFLFVCFVRRDAWYAINYSRIAAVIGHLLFLAL